MSVVTWGSTQTPSFSALELPDSGIVNTVKLSKALVGYLSPEVLAILNSAGFKEACLTLVVEGEGAIRAGAPTRDEMAVTGEAAAKFWGEIVKSSDKRVVVTNLKVWTTLLESGLKPETLMKTLADRLQVGFRDKFVRGVLSYAMVARDDADHLNGVCATDGLLTGAGEESLKAVFKRVLGEGAEALAELIVRSARHWAKTVDIGILDAYAENQLKSVEALIGDAIGKTLHKGVLLKPDDLEKRIEARDQNLKGYTTLKGGKPQIVNGKVKCDVLQQRSITVSRPGSDKLVDGEELLLENFAKIYRYAIGGDELNQFKDCKSIEQKRKLLATLKKHKSEVDTRCQIVARALGVRDKQVRADPRFLAGMKEKNATESLVFREVANLLKAEDAFTKLNFASFCDHATRELYLASLLGK